MAYHGNERFSFEVLQERCSAFNKAMYGDNPQVPFNKPFAFVSHFIHQNSNAILETQISVGKPSYSPVSLMDGTFLRERFPDFCESPDVLEARIMLSEDFDLLYTLGELKKDNYAQKLEDFLRENKNEMLDIVKLKHIDYFNKFKTKPIDYIQYRKTQIAVGSYISSPDVSPDLQSPIRQDVLAVLSLEERSYS